MLVAVNFHWDGRTYVDRHFIQPVDLFHVHYWKETPAIITIQWNDEVWTGIDIEQFNVCFLQIQRVYTMQPVVQPAVQLNSRLYNRLMFVYTIEPVVQPVASCKRGFRVEWPKYKETNGVGVHVGIITQLQVQEYYCWWSVIIRNTNRNIVRPIGLQIIRYDRKYLAFRWRLMDIQLNLLYGTPPQKNKTEKR